MKKSLKNSVILKGLCYICIPIFAIIVLLCIIYSSWLVENEDIKTSNTFEETNSFANVYYSAFNLMVSKVKYSDSYFYRFSDDIYMAESYYRTSEEIKYVIIDNDNKVAYTNLFPKSNYLLSIEELKNELLSTKNAMYCNYNCATKQIDTNIPNSRIEKLYNSRLGNELEKFSSYEFYTVVNYTGDINNDFTVRQIAFDMTKTFGSMLIICIPFFIFLIIIMCIYLILAIGHKKDYQGIYLNAFDKWPMEISFGITAFGLVVIFIIMNSLGWDNMNSITNVIMATIWCSLLVTMYALVAIIGTTFIKKLKSHTLWNSSLIYKTVKWVQKVFNSVISNIGTNGKVIVKFLGVILISIILVNMNALGIILLLAFWGFLLYQILSRVNEFNKIKDTLKNIYNGKTDVLLNSEEFQGELKEVSVYINDIQSGFSNAVNESLKSERMKTELITNVSHDIKTPLTSIINYVDLLKQEEITNEKAKGYIEVLDGKAQRLKKLIEDLVEASKASSGNIKLHIERINLVELIKQTTGEFEDKFKEKNLQIELDLSDDNIYIDADNRYMYRVIENVFSNIAKYALEGSRVYIDVTKNNEQAKIEIKNISKDKLNITADELMQRFVRGDKSRTTEGSGLGLSISKSLTELQNGKFNVIIDGDLFKVEIVF